jgi:hypothetical protein
VVLWLAAQRLPTVSREQIRRHALGQAVDAAGSDRVIAELVARGWLRPMDAAPGREGRPPLRWQVHRVAWSEAGLVGADDARDAWPAASTWRDPHPIEQGDPAPAVPAIPAASFVAAHHFSGASPEAPAEGDFDPTDPRQAAPALSEAPFVAARHAGGASPGAPEAGDFDPTDRREAAPAVPAVSATAFVAARHAGGASPEAPEAGDLDPTDRREAAPAVPAVSAASLVGGRHAGGAPRQASPTTT